MEQFEFDEACRKFRDQWPKSMSDQRASMIFKKWQKLPKGVFGHAVNSMIYQGGHPPAGEQIDDFVNAAIKKHNEKNTNFSSAKLPPGCKDCRMGGYIRMMKDGYESTCTCMCPLGMHYHENYGMPHKEDLLQRGYVRFNYEKFYGGGSK